MPAPYPPDGGLACPPASSWLCRALQPPHWGLSKCLGLVEGPSPGEPRLGSECIPPPCRSHLLGYIPPITPPLALSTVGSALPLAGPQLRGPRVDDPRVCDTAQGHQGLCRLGPLELPALGKAAAMAGGRASGLRCPLQRDQPDAEGPLSTHPPTPWRSQQGWAWLGWQGLRLHSSPGWCCSGCGKTPARLRPRW